MTLQVPYLPYHYRECELGAFLYSHLENGGQSLKDKHESLGTRSIVMFQTHFSSSTVSSLLLLSFSLQFDLEVVGGEPSIQMGATYSGIDLNSLKQGATGLEPQ